MKFIIFFSYIKDMSKIPQRHHPKLCTSLLKGGNIEERERIAETKNVQIDGETLEMRKRKMIDERFREKKTNKENNE